MRTGFISSTILDLKDLRNFLSFELGAHGFNMLLSEEGSIPTDTSKHSYELCLDAAKDCDFLVAVIDGRFGGEVPKSGGKSITLAEIETAMAAGKHVYVFVRQAVWDAKEVLKPYAKARVKFRPSKIVEDERVFEVIDAIRKRVVGNWIFTFNRPDEVLKVLSDQMGFRLREPGNPDLDKLDRILARKALKAFNQRVMSTFVEGVQIQIIPTWAADEFDDAVEQFSTQVMRFAGSHSRKVFEKFMDNAWNLAHEAPSVFKDADNNPNILTARVPPGTEHHPKSIKQFKDITKLALDTNNTWMEFFEFVRRTWPELIVEMHVTDETK